MNAQDVVQLINDIRFNQQQDDKIHVLPLMCGTGKSTAISYLIRQTIEEASDTGNGLLVVTDRVDRMDDYMHPHIIELENYLIDHESQVCIMASDNIEEANRLQKAAPVLMMTTQRYFRLSITEINRYLEWYGGQRTQIIIDEYPELMTVVELDSRGLSDCKSAIANTFRQKPYVPGEHSVTDEVETTEEYFNAFIAQLRSGECERRDNLRCFWSWQTELNIGHYNMHKKPDTSFQLITKNKEIINRYGGGTYYYDNYTRVKAIRQLKEDRALIYHHKFENGTYYDIMRLLLDNYELIHEINARVIILDGTADLSPQYSPERFLFSQNSKRRLDHLHIKIINYPTGKTSLINSKEKQNKLIDIVELYQSEILQSDPNMAQDEWVIFTYMPLEHTFKKRFGKNNVEHFGNIKGKNDFRKARHIFQVGLNRYPDDIYYLVYLTKHPSTNKYENTQEASNGYLSIIGYNGFQLNQEYVIAQSDEIDAEMQDLKGETREIMNRMLLAEIEQNLFRGIIRNSDSEEDFTFHLFINTDNYSDLIDLMRQRYEPLGATIDFAPFSLTVALQKSLNRKGSTYIQRLVRWHDSLPYNAEYTPALIREKIGMTSNSAVSSYQQMLHHNPAIRILMNEEKQKRGLYKKAKNWNPRR